MNRLIVTDILLRSAMLSDQPVDADKTIDCSTFGKAVMAWHGQWPNISYNECRIFDEYYKLLFRPDYDPPSARACATSAEIA
jgi:hypothetical protein